MFTQTSVSNTELYGMNNAWKERSEERKRKVERERELRISEKGNWIMISLNEIKYNPSHLYMNEFTHKIGSRTF